MQPQTQEIDDVNEYINEKLKIFRKLVFSASIILLVIVYFLEFRESYVKEHLPSIVPFLVGVHWFFFICGWMLVGFPFSYTIRSAINRITPRKLSAMIEESKKMFPLSHYSTDMFWWTIFLPALFGGIIVISISIHLNLVPFELLYYILPFAGIIYLAFNDKFEETLGIAPPEGG